MSARLADQYQRQFGRPADASDPQYGAWVKTSLPQMISADQQAYQRSKNRWNTFGKLATGAAIAPLAAVSAPALFGGAGATGAAASTGYSSPGVFGGLFGGGAAAGGAAAPAVTTAARFTLPNILKFAEIGVPAVTSLFGMRAQNNALKQQGALEQRNLQEQMAFAREQEAQRRAEYDRQMAEESRRWDVENQNRARELAAAEEDRAFNRRLIEEREARNAQRRMQLAQFLGYGR